MTSTDVSSQTAPQSPEAGTVDMKLELIGRGVDVSEVFHYGGRPFHSAGTEARVPGPDPQGRSYATWASFSDPDGNGWLLQEINTRLPGRC
jgi:hypothetical protein